jgi:hypothetical protein
MFLLLPAHFSYNEFNLFNFWRLLAPFSYNDFIFLRLPAHFSYNEINLSIFLRLPAHFSYNEFNFLIFGACRRTLDTMTST